MDKCQNCDSEILSIIELKSNLKIIVCKKCNAVWQIYNNEITRMYALRKHNRYILSREEIVSLCPICNSPLTGMYEEHSIKCSDPCCSYKKRLPGRNQKEKQDLKDYKNLQNNIFKRITNCENVSEEEFNKLKELKKRIELTELQLVQEENSKDD